MTNPIYELKIHVDSIINDFIMFGFAVHTMLIIFLFSVNILLCLIFYFISSTIFKIALILFIINFIFMIPGTLIKSIMSFYKYSPHKYDLKINEYYLKTDSGTESLLWNWDDILNVYETRLTFAVFLKRDGLFIIPKRCFENKHILLAFKRYLYKYVPNEKLIMKKIKLIS